MSTKHLKVNRISLPFLTALILIGQVTGAVPITSAEAASLDQEYNTIIIETIENKQSETRDETGADIVTISTSDVYAAAPTSKSGFTDVDDSKYYAEAISWAVENNITNGIGNNQFGVNGTVTRAQAVTFLWRAMGTPSPKRTSSTFEDVERNSWYEKAVQWAIEGGITNGVGDNKFNPDGLVTRGQLITFLWRAKGQPGEQKQGDQWYSASERWAKEKSLLTGTAIEYKTDDACPRCDVVYYLWREVKATKSSRGSKSGSSGGQSDSKQSGYVGSIFDLMIPSGEGTSGSTKASEGIVVH